MARATHRRGRIGAKSSHFLDTGVLMRGAAAASIAAMTDLRHDLGLAGERLAAEHLERLGYDILARRHRTRFGELDLVAADEHTIVFVEVKSRRTSGRPWDAMTVAKCEQVRRMAAAWLAEVTDRPRRAALRFDAVGIVLDGRGELVELEHLEDAF